MRFLKYFMGIVILALLVMGGSFVAWEEVRVHLAARDLAREMTQLSEMMIKNRYTLVCSGDNYKVSDIKDNGIEGVQDVQLRFENETDYLTEVRCEGWEKKSSLVDELSLKYGVEKIAGSGLRIQPNQDPDTMNATVLLKGRYRVMKVDWTSKGARVSRGSLDDDVEVVSSAETSCQGWGGRCCTPPQLVGDGGRQELVIEDCPRDCFEACQQRPLVIFFNTSPIMNITDRVLNLDNSSEMVTFSYQTDDLDGDVASVILEFGDGEKYVGSIEDRVDHDYECSKSRCIFIARLNVVDDEGLVQSTSPKNIVTIMMPGR